MQEIQKARIRGLYDYLSRHPGQWLSMKPVVHDMRHFYPLTEGSNFHNSLGRRMLTADIQAINASPAYEKIVIKGNHGIKLATEQEASAYIGNMYASVFRKLKRVRAIEKKAALDGQFQILTDNYINAFADGGEMA